jgi:hypothetical protein
MQARASRAAPKAILPEPFKRSLRPDEYRLDVRNKPYIPRVRQLVYRLVAAFVVVHVSYKFDCESVFAAPPGPTSRSRQSVRASLKLACFPEWQAPPCLTCDYSFFPDAVLVIDKPKALHPVTEPDQFPAHLFQAIFGDEGLGSLWLLARHVNVHLPLQEA